MTGWTVTYAPDALGVPRPVVTITWATGDMVAGLPSRARLRELWHDAPPPAVTRTRAPGEYAEVVEAWRYFDAIGPTPTRDIAALYAVPYTTASRWLTVARAKGLLAPTCRGNGGGIPPLSSAEVKRRSRARNRRKVTR